MTTGAAVNASRGNHGVMTIWDAAGDPPGDDSLVFRWSGLEEGGAVRSLFRYVEANGEELRRKYLAWVHELGESRVAGTRIRLKDAFVRRDGLSYWWMTTFVEQSPWKSPGIVDAVRLLALEQIILARRPSQVRLVSANGAVHQVLRDFCRELAIPYVRKSAGRAGRARFTLRRAYHALPSSFRAVVATARHLAERWPLRQGARAGWLGGDGATCFVSYFFHLDTDACRSGRFHSRYWEELPGVLRAAACPVNWLHLFVKSGSVPAPSVALDWVERFNSRPEREGFHSFLDTYLTFGLVLRAGRSWVRLWLLSWRHRHIRHAFRPAGSHLSLWPVLRDDWSESMRGPTAAGNLLLIELFDAALRSIPPQSTGIYVCENHSWERAMIHAWRKHGHGRLIACAHSTTRFWDLRYFSDPRTVRDTGPHALPRADVLVLNGNAQVKAYAAMDYPRDSFAECEALRYGYLADLVRGAAAPRDPDGPLRVLVLGDYSASDTGKALSLLSRAASLLPPDAAFTLRPHPNHSPAATDHGIPGLAVAGAEPLERILSRSHVAYASNGTSAAVDAYIAGLPVVVLLDEAQLNFSPLRGMPGVHFVSTPEELATALTARAESGRATAARAGIFHLDADLPRWKALLRVEDCAN